MQSKALMTVSAAIVLAIGATAVLAQATPPRVALINETSPISVALAAPSGMVKTKSTGDLCLLRPNDTVTMVGPDTKDAQSVIVKRDFHAQMPDISGATCKTGALITMKADVFARYEAARRDKAAADDAAKAAKAAERAKKKS